MTKEQRLIKDQVAQIADLTNELNDIHATFDLLGIPSKVKNTYRDLTANARLTLFLAQTNGIKVEQPKDGE